MLTEEQIAEALIKKCGNIMDAAKVLKVTRQALYHRINESEALQEARRVGRETILDIAESEALKQIRLGNTAMIIFTLKTQGKERGYVERSEVSGPNGGPIVVKGYMSVTPDDWDDAKG